MESLGNPKTPEEITHIIENFADQEGMAVEDLYSDIITFDELGIDDDTKEYFFELQERMGITPAEMIQAAKAYAEAQGLEE